MTLKNKIISSSKLKNRISRYKSKEFKVILSKEIPGSIFKIEAFSIDSENPEDLVRETLVFQGIKTNKELRNQYKQKNKEDKI